MTSSHKKRRAGLTVAVCLLLICLVAAGTFFALLHFRLKKLQSGATFEFDYTITAVSETDAPVLYSILQSADGTQGRVTGQYAPQKLQVNFYQQEQSQPFTRLYIDQDETLYDLGQLYTYLRSILVESYPLSDLILPEWGLGDYISQTQMAAVLGADLQNVELQDMTGFTLALAAMKKAHPANAVEGYTYYSLSSGEENSPELILGLPLGEFFHKSIPMHILLSIPDHGVTVDLFGTLSPAETAVIAPDSRMRDEDINTVVQIREAVQSIWDTIQSYT